MSHNLYNFKHNRSAGKVWAAEWDQILPGKILKVKPLIGHDVATLSKSENKSHVVTNGSYAWLKRGKHYLITGVEFFDHVDPFIFSDKINVVIIWVLNPEYSTSVPVGVDLPDMKAYMEFYDPDKEEE